MQATPRMDPEHTTLADSSTEGHTVCDSVYRKRPEHANPRRQGAGSWRLGAGAGRGQWLLMRTATPLGRTRMSGTRQKGRVRSALNALNAPLNFALSIGYFYVT